MQNKNNMPGGGGGLDQPRSSEIWRDRRAGLLMAGIGAFAAVTGARYGIGTLSRIGPGFFPTVLGIVLVVLGLAIAFTATLAQDHEAGHGHAAQDAPIDWRGYVAIVASMVLFIVLTPVLGLVPGTFACVFTAAMGDRKMTVLNSAVLAAVISVAGALLFIWGLRVGLPYFGS